MKDLRQAFTELFRRLEAAYGPQNWWPADSAFEIVVGAVLTQNAAWSNVEKAIANLKAAGVMELKAMVGLGPERLGQLVRPAGYYNLKARRLLNLLEFIMERYSGDLEKMFTQPTDVLRQQLLEVKGIGPETADSILLYAGGHRIFVVDAYTRRVLARHGLVSPRADYHEIQRLFMDNLPPDTDLYAELHALIVALGKHHCRPRAPRCRQCPARGWLGTEGIS